MDFKTYIKTLPQYPNVPKLWLDDERLPKIVPDSWIVVKTYTEFCNAINTHGWQTFKFYSFDNDLGHGNGEGRDCARYLMETIKTDFLTSTQKSYNAPIIRVHSWNNVARNHISFDFEKFFEIYSFKFNRQSFVCNYPAQAFEFEIGSSEFLAWKNAKK